MNGKCVFILQSHPLALCHADAAAAEDAEVIAASAKAWDMMFVESKDEMYESD